MTTSEYKRYTNTEKFFQEMIVKVVLSPVKSKHRSYMIEITFSKVTYEMGVIYKIHVCIEVKMNVVVLFGDR